MNQYELETPNALEIKFDSNKKVTEDVHEAGLESIIPTS